MQRGEAKRNGGETERVTINAEFDWLSPDVRLLPIALEQLVLDGRHQSGTGEVELNREIGSSHFDRALGASFTLISAIRSRSGKTARSDEEV